VVEPRRLEPLSPALQRSRGCRQASGVVADLLGDAVGLLLQQLESASPDLLRAMVKTFADALMSAEADAVLGGAAVACPRLRADAP
jgi:hypothetical protein